MQVEFQFAE